MCSGHLRPDLELSSACWHRTAGKFTNGRALRVYVFKTINTYRGSALRVSLKEANNRPSICKNEKAVLKASAIGKNSPATGVRSQATFSGGGPSCY